MSTALNSCKLCGGAILKVVTGYGGPICRCLRDQTTSRPLAPPPMPVVTIKDWEDAQLNARLSKIVDGIISSTSLEFLIKNGITESIIRAKSIARTVVEETKKL
jgi:hypothetical protein